VEIKAGDMVEIYPKETGVKSQKAMIVKKEGDGKEKRLISVGFLQETLHYLYWEVKEIKSYRVLNGEEKETFEESLKEHLPYIFNNKFKVDCHLAMDYFGITHEYDKETKVLKIKNDKGNQIDLNLNVYKKEEIWATVTQRLRDIQKIIGELGIISLVQSIMETYTDKLRNVFKE